MEFNNKIMLITYPDSMGENLRDLNHVLNRHFQGAIGGVHILPFFPSSADRGFAPICYDRVDPAFGNWDDIASLSEKYYLMYDFMVNHISRQSAYFKDFSQKKDQSAYHDMFIRYEKFWPNGEPTDRELDQIYKRTPNAPYVEVAFRDGTNEKVWRTFSDEQIDLNVNSDTTKKFIRDTVTGLKAHHASIIRLDAFAFTIKKLGTNCFFVEPEIWDLLHEIQSMVDTEQPEKCFVLPEIHEHYTIQLSLAKNGFWVYDFALPMLMLHAIYLKNAAPLKHWLKICPRKQFTTLDTHDGIGVVDVKDLLSDKEIEETKETLFQKGANVKKIYNSVLYHNLDVYQINCTYYSALGNNDDAYLLARAVQFFAPGVPQVYYVGLLAGENDLKLMEETKVGRNINRHAYSVEEINQSIERPVVQKLIRLMRFRNRYPAFNGECTITETANSVIEIHRTLEHYETVLKADLNRLTFGITYRTEDGNMATLDLES